MIYGKDTLRYLASRFDFEDTHSSSHWQLYHRFLEIDEGLSVRKARGFGDSRKHSINFLGIADNILQNPFKKMVGNSELFLFFSKLARSHCKIQNRRFSLDVLRQVLTLTFLKSDFDIRCNDVSIVIGDGYGTLTSLLLGSGISKKVIVINLTKTLFVDVSYLLLLPEFAKKHSIMLAHTKDDIARGVEDEEVKIIAVEAKNFEILAASEASLAFNIASMQEMNMPQINGYFSCLRMLAKQNDVYFYCCNRDEKTLPDGTLIQFDEYPWHSEDQHLVDDLCPWHQYYYRLMPPGYLKYDGPIRHRYTKIKAV